MKLEQLIEELSMAITHSEQGVYSKNEKIVRDLLEPFISTQIKKATQKERERIIEEFTKEQKKL